MTGDPFTDGTLRKRAGVHRLQKNLCSIINEWRPKFSHLALWGSGAPEAVHILSSHRLSSVFTILSFLLGFAQWEVAGLTEKPWVIVLRFQPLACGLAGTQAFSDDTVRWHSREGDMQERIRTDSGRERNNQLRQMRCSETLLCSTHLLQRKDAAWWRKNFIQTWRDMFIWWYSKKWY